MSAPLRNILHWRPGVLFATLVYALGDIRLVPEAMAQTPASSDAAFTRRFNSMQTVRVLAAHPKECEAWRTRPAEAPTPIGWEPVRELGAQARCVRLAQGATRVLSDPESVLSWFAPATPSRASKSGSNPVQQAQGQLWVAERMLRARALLRSGKGTEAFAEFSVLETQVPLEKWHVFALHDFAVAAAQLERFEVAVAGYRRLLSVKAWLPAEMKVSVLVEAALALLHVSPPRSSEALGLLQELESETLGSEIAWVSSVLHLVASTCCGSADPLPDVPPHSSPPWAAPSLRLTEADRRFFETLAHHSQTGQWSDEHRPGDDDGRLTFASPVFAEFIERVKAKP